MGRSLIFSTNFALRFSQKPRSILPPSLPSQSIPLNSRQQLQNGSQRFGLSIPKPARTLCTKAVLSEIPNQKQYVKVGAQSTGPIPASQLIEVVEKAAKTGAEVCSLSLFCASLDVLALLEFCKFRRKPNHICILSCPINVVHPNIWTWGYPIKKRSKKIDLVYVPSFFYCDDFLILLCTM